MPKPETVKFAYYCTCGGTHSGSCSPRLIPKMKAIWEQFHAGPGHSPCDSKTAAAARRKQDREEAHAG